MHIIKITFRSRNDFHFISHCRHCGDQTSWGDGYADAYYQQVVFPHRRCPKCGLDEYGEAAPVAASRGEAA